MHKDFQKVHEFISKNDKFIISTHESPDADGLGSEIGFLELLKNLGKKAIIINSDPAPEICKFIDLDNELNVLHENIELPNDIEEYVQFVLDTNDYENIGSAYHSLHDKVKDCFIIDHHEKNADTYKNNFIKVEASSACEIIFDIIKYYKKDYSFKTAQALFTGIIFDTGSFKYSKTSSHTFEIAAALTSKGAKPVVVHQHLYESNSIENFELRSHILSSMEVFQDGKLIFMRLTPEMLKKTGAIFSEGEPSINLPLTIKNVVIKMQLDFVQN